MCVCSVSQMERSPVISWLFHLRAVSLFSILLFVDYMFVRHSWNTLHSKGPSVSIVFGLEVSSHFSFQVVAITISLVLFFYFHCCLDTIGRAVVGSLYSIECHVCSYYNFNNRKSVIPFLLMLFVNCLFNVYSIPLSIGFTVEQAGYL